MKPDLALFVECPACGATHDRELLRSLAKEFRRCTGLVDDHMCGMDLGEEQLGMKGASDAEAMG